MKYHRTLVVLLAIVSTGCSGTSWRARDFSLFGKKDKAPETVSQMLASGSTKSTISKSSKKKTKSDSKVSTTGSTFIERMGSARSNEQSAKLDLARSTYEKLIVEFPQRPEPYHRLGVVADKQRRHREAQNLYAQALQRKPLDAEIFNDLGYCFFLQGKLTKAESAMTKAVSLSPSDERVRNNLGMVLGHLGKDELALEHFRHAGSEADAQYNLAFVQMSRGNSDKAQHRLELALMSDPSHEQARVALEEIDSMPINGEELAENDSQARPTAPPKKGHYVPYLEEVDQATPNSILTGGSEPIQEVGTTTNQPRHFVPNPSAGRTGTSPHQNAATRSLQAADLGGSNQGQTQALQAQARAMMEARLSEQR